MLKATFWSAAAIAAVMVVSASTEAEAFCHKYRSVPMWLGAYYPNCGPCGGCIMPYVASGAYAGGGYCGVGCGYGCGAYGCGTAYGSGYGCMKRHRFAAHRAWKQLVRGCGSCFGCYGDCGYGDCGYGDCGGCYAGCGDCGGCGSDCGDGGCSDCGNGGVVDGGTEGGEILYDGPAPADEGTPTTTTTDPSASVRRPLIMLAGMRSQQADGSGEFEKGVNAYRSGSLNDASQAFDAAASAEPDNALYHYYRALTMHDLYGAEAAEEARQLAVEAERREPIKGWGKRMERVQGRARVWIEKARRDAGLVK
jgi:hypothetical protein